MNEYPFNPGDFRPLFEITNELRELTTSPADLNWARQARILRDLCFSLTSAFDKGFEQVLHSAEANDPATKQFARHILNDFAIFTGFPRFEKDVLVKCGVEKLTADAILTAIKPLYGEIRQMEFDPSKTVSAIQSLRDEVCKASHSARRVMDRKGRSRRQTAYDENLLHRLKRRRLVIHRGDASGNHAVCSDLNRRRRPACDPSNRCKEPTGPSAALTFA